MGVKYSNHCKNMYYIDSGVRQHFNFWNDSKNTRAFMYLSSCHHAGRTPNSNEWRLTNDDYEFTKSLFTLVFIDASIWQTLTKPFSSMIQIIQYFAVIIIKSSHSGSISRLLLTDCNWQIVMQLRHSWVNVFVFCIVIDNKDIFQFPDSHAATPEVVT